MQQAQVHIKSFHVNVRLVIRIKDIKLFGNAYVCPVAATDPMRNAVQRIQAKAQANLW